MYKVAVKREVDLEQLKEILARLDFDYFLSLDPDMYKLDTCDNLKDIYSLDRVRFFSAQKQLEWRLNSNTYHLVIIAPQEELEIELYSDFKLEELKLVTEKKIYLWGELDYEQYQQGEIIFYEGQIPKLLSYPLSGEELGPVQRGEIWRAFIEVNEYDLVEEEHRGAKLEHYRYLGAEKLS